MKEGIVDCYNSADGVQNQIDVHMDGKHMDLHLGDDSVA